jgi:hypothetical protein
MFRTMPCPLCQQIPNSFLFEYCSHVTQHSVLVLTVLLAHSRKYNVSLLVNLNISYAPFTPFPQQDSNLLPDAATRHLHAEIPHRRLESKETGEPVLPRLNLPCDSVGIVTIAILGH